MRLHNTLTDSKETLERPVGRPLSLFVCGPTVYDYAHIGHARTYIAFDLLVRFLRSMGWEVDYLQNITDVDDRIIDRAKANGVTPEVLAEEFERAYKEDMERIGAVSVSRYARASDHIEYIVRQVETLNAKGYAYEIPGNGYYFDIAKFPEYGKLSKRTAAQAEDAVTRIDEHLAKRNKGDFALWKSVAVDGAESDATFVLADGEPAWRTALGWGRPGWHIEDTAITEHFFGPQYDVHGGAEDLKFPHHEAEIAQQEAASGKKPFVRMWLHTGFMRVDGAKMGKSLGNFVTIRDFLASHSVETLRWLIASHHYRSPINYTAETAETAARSLDALHEFLDKLSFIERTGAAGGDREKTKEEAEAVQTRFRAALEDDFNTPGAIGELFQFVNAQNAKLWSLSPEEAQEAEKPVHNALSLFGIPYLPAPVSEAATRLAAARELCRTNKQFAQADDLRKQIGGLGYSVDDTPIGPFLRKTGNH